MDHEAYRLRTNALTAEALTLRDHFAAAALTGLLNGRGGLFDHETMENCTDWAFRYADAMLDHRTLKKETP